MQRAVFFMLLLGCGGGTTSGPDASVGDGGASSCGTSGQTQGDECARIDGCDGLGGEPNLGAAACDNCPAEARYSVCNAGVCETYDRSGQIEAGFNANSAAEGGRSVITMVIDPRMADGTQVRCAALTSSCGLVDNLLLNVVNVQILEPLPAIARDLAYRAPASAHVGTDRLVLVQITSGTGGDGQILTQGCAEGVSVVSGENTQVLIELSP